MPRSHNPDLHGNAPDTSPVALLIIDMVNALDWEGADVLLPQAVRAAERIADLKRHARAAGVPVIYANDNFGRWRSDFREVVDHCRHDGVPGRPLVELLAPTDDDYFILKPKHSAFYATTLDLLLEYLGAKQLVLTGIAGEACVAFTAMDAYLRDYVVHVPADATASKSAEHNAAALAYLARVLHARTGPVAGLDFVALKKAAQGA